MMKCPRDQWTLRTEKADGVTFHQCNRCGGMFVCLEGDRFSFDMAQLSAAIRVRSRIHSDADLESPVGKIAMQPFFYQGVELDYCESLNSIWFDRGELEKIGGAVPKEKVKLTQKPRESYLTSIGESGADIVGELGFDFVIEFVIDAIGGIFN